MTTPFDDLDRVIHEPARLSLLTSLAGHPRGLRFNELKAACGLTDGNLSRHLSTLETAGLVAIEKSFAGKRPQTRARLTAEGRRRLLEYLSLLEKVVRDAAAAARASTEPNAAPASARRRLAPA